MMYRSLQAKYVNACLSQELKDNADVLEEMEQVSQYLACVEEAFQHAGSEYTVVGFIDCGKKYLWDLLNFKRNAIFYAWQTTFHYENDNPVGVWFPWLFSVQCRRYSIIVLSKPTLNFHYLVSNMKNSFRTMKNQLDELKEMIETIRPVVEPPKKVM